MLCSLLPSPFFLECDTQQLSLCCATAYQGHLCGWERHQLPHQHHECTLLQVTGGGKGHQQGTGTHKMYSLS